MSGQSHDEGGHGSSPQQKVSGQFLLLQERSCVECSRRKVRCDRRIPCSNCSRHGTTCEFPRFRKRPVRQRRSMTKSSASNTTESISADHADTRHQASPSGDTSLSQGRDIPGISAAEEPHWLIRDQGRSRYIGNSFWARMSRDVAEMRDVLDESSSEDGGSSNDDEQSYGRRTPDGQVDHESFIFRPISYTSHAIMPTHEELLTILDIFYDNVDPVAKIFHRDVVRQIVAQPLQRCKELTKAGEAVLFSIYFAAATSLVEHQCQRLLGERPQVLLPKLRLAVERALSRAQFLQSQNLSVLSALVLFLMVVRRHDTSRFVSGLLGVAIRNAQGMGLHRDGSNFQLSPFQTELRRRIWWHISVLDLRSSEDHGVDPTILDCAHDTLFPTNINDADISINTDVPPVALTGLTDMSFCLVRFEVCVAIRKLHYRDPLTSTPANDKRAVVEYYEKHFQERFIDPCDVTKPLHWTAATWARLMLAKMWLTVLAPIQSPGNRDDESRRQEALAKALEMLELTNLLETSPRSVRWQWLFLTHTQWHAVVFVLACLCEQPHNQYATRAWDVIQAVYVRWTPGSSSRKGMLWKPLQRLLDKAKRIRQGKLAPDRRLSASTASPETTITIQPPALITKNGIDQIGGNNSKIVPVGENAESFDETSNANTNDQELFWDEWTSILQEADLAQREAEDDTMIALDPSQTFSSSLWGTL